MLGPKLQFLLLRMSTKSSFGFPAYTTADEIFTMRPFLFFCIIENAAQCHIDRAAKRLVQDLVEIFVGNSFRRLRDMDGGAVYEDI